MKKNQLRSKRIIISLSLCLVSASVMHAQNYTINTVAGNGTSGFSGDGGQATNAQISAPYGIYGDASGNIFIPDDLNNRIRIVNSGGVINTYAGTGISGFAGDGGQATAAELSSPTGVAGKSGNIFIADGGNNRIRQVTPGGVITTFAGTGIAGFYGDGGKADTAQLHFPAGLTVDASGNLYIADVQNQRIRKVNTNGIITTIAGNGTNGYNGDNIQATNAELGNPFGVAVDMAGNVYIADQFNHRIRMVNTNGIITTVAGTGVAGYTGDGAQATLATIDRPFDVSVDGAGNLYIADFANNAIRKVSNAGVITSIAGTGVASFSGDGGPATAATLHGPTGISLDPSDNLFITDQSNSRIRELNIICNVTATSGGINTSGGMCNGEAWVTPGGGTAPYSYLWSPGGATTDTIKSLCGNNYCCTITDNLGCVHVACVTVTGITEISSLSSVKVYPNPTTGSFVVSGLSKGQTVEVYNYAGQKIGYNMANESIMQFDISSQSAGVYLVRIISEDGKDVRMEKIMKTN